MIPLVKVTSREEVQEGDLDHKIAWAQVHKVKAKERK